MPITEQNRFSCFVEVGDAKGYALIEKWEQWFRECNIPCAIARTDKGFAVYRLGLQDDDF